MSDRSDDTGHVPEVSESDDAAAAPPPDAEGATRTEPAGPETVPDTADATAPIAAAATELDDRTRVVPAAAPVGGLQGAAVAPSPAPLSEAEHAALLEHPNGKPFLRARGLSAKGHQGRIFTDVELTASLGQVVAVCGDGGDGRSSLLLALAGRFAHHEGTLEVDGQTKPGQIRRRFTIAQAGPPIRFDPYHTVATCIKETTAVSKGAATRANITAWLDRLAIGVDTGDTYGFLPRIDQIGFAIACAAACRTPAIVVDDADTGLDRSGSERVFEALRTVADAGQLVLAACTRTDPPADTVIDLRGHDCTAAKPNRDDQGAADQPGHADQAASRKPGRDDQRTTRRQRRERARNGEDQ